MFFAEGGGSKPPSVELDREFMQEVRKVGLDLESNKDVPIDQKQESKFNQQEKEILDKYFRDKTLTQIIELFKDPNQELQAVLNNSGDRIQLIRNLEKIADEVRVTGTFTTDIEEKLKNFSDKNDLRINVQEAIAREIVSFLDFRTFKNLNDIYNLLQKFKYYLSSRDGLFDEYGNNIDLNKYLNNINRLIGLKNNKKMLPIRLSKIKEMFTNQYNLQEAVEGCFGPNEIVDDVNQQI